MGHRSRRGGKGPDIAMLPSEDELIRSPGAVVEPFEALTRLVVETTTVAGALQLVINSARHVVPTAGLVSVTPAHRAARSPHRCGPTRSRSSWTKSSTAAALARASTRPTLMGPATSPARTSPPKPAGRGSPPPRPATATDPSCRRSSSPPPAAIACAARSTCIPTTAAASPTTSATPPSCCPPTPRSRSPTPAAPNSPSWNAQLRQAISTRDLIGQAKGILMQRQGADEAFAVLQRTSQDLNVKLVDLARTVTARHRELGDE
ncbi:MAG TPA: ANTAR domain-containing protein [Amycolatopsis sp.]|nr:ANTAR domain-containing protein [Amycolatopsis sp.]